MILLQNFNSYFEISAVDFVWAMAFDLVNTVYSPEQQRRQTE